MDKYVYAFHEGSRHMRELLGGKGANLAEMTRIGLPVPYGFTVTTEACRRYYEEGQTLPDDIRQQIREKLEELEAVAEKKLGDRQAPLLVSVRSGSVFSMPGMMDTILNLGLNDRTVIALAELTGDLRFARDSYRRLIQMFGNVVMGIPMDRFEQILEAQKARRGVDSDVALTEEDLKEIIAGYEQVYRQATGEHFPQNPQEQLLRAIEAVFRSWNNARAVLYRKLNRIPDDLGTAVNVQTMVFGNMGDTSGTGVAFTRSPVDGERQIFGEFLVNAQGEDVVAGIRTPLPIAQMEQVFPKAFEKFMSIAEVLEKHYTDMQDMEFTIENGKLYMLQTRAGKRTVAAAVRMAVDMVEEELIDKETAVSRVDADGVIQLLHPAFADGAEIAAVVLASGLPASPGAASGRICLSAEQAKAFQRQGESAILVRRQTSPDDLAGMTVAEGILTGKGGMTSHAAVVARQMGKPCVCGCHQLDIHEETHQVRLGETTLAEGDWISFNGGNGRVYAGKLDKVPVRLSDDFIKILSWADGIRALKVRANADTPADVAKAIEFGAEGVGLCRTEHMFFSADRIPAIQQMILAETEEERKAALDQLLPFQRDDFVQLYRVMENLPVTIRLLDPPLHEFLPRTREEQAKLSRKSGISMEALERRMGELEESNPMLGHRGCRLAISYPEMVTMQTHAIIQAAVQVQREEGISVSPEIMIPLVCSAVEMSEVKKIVEAAAAESLRELNAELDYTVGTMIELPRACMRAEDIAREADFFSFGTNDLTQTSFGLSRDDTGDIVQTYLQRGILQDDMFQTLDTQGVGRLMEIAVKEGRQGHPGLKMGVCGEHGGDARSIAFFHQLGLNYVSASPYRVPTARLAAAQAAIKSRDE